MAYDNKVHVYRPVDAQNYIWNPETLAWERATGSVMGEAVSVNNFPALQEVNDSSLLLELQKKADLTETQPVSAAALPLPSGAATETTLATVSQTLIDGVNITGVVETQSAAYTKRFEELVDGTMYVGKALAGALEADAVWQLSYITDAAVLFASGEATFDKVWEDRATYSYE